MPRFACATLVALTLAACEGEAGPPGPQGPAGPSGADVTSTRACQVAAATLPLVFEYRVVRYSNGDAETMCAIWDNRSQHSSSAYYRAGQQGAAAGICFLVYDVDDTPSTGYWQFSSDPSEHALYVDPTSARNGEVVSFPACVSG